MKNKLLHYLMLIVPITFMNEDFDELADYLAINYKPDFAKKIIFIAFTILCYYDSAVFSPGNDFNLEITLANKII